MKPFTSALRTMDDAAAEDGEPHAGADDRRWTCGQQVTVEDDEVCVQPRSARAPRRCSAKAAKAEPAVYASSASREREPLRREPAARGLTVHGLAVHRVVERDERVERDHRPVGSEREAPARLGRWTPGPGPARPLRPDVPGPHVDLVGRRVAVVRLHRGDHAQGANRPMSAGSMVSMCSTRCRRAWVPGTAPVPCGSPAQGPLARAACSNASRARRTPRSPMACSSTCQPRRSASATNASSSSGSQAGRPRPVSPSYGSSIDAVRASITPSTKPLRMPASSRSPPRSAEGHALVLVEPVPPLGQGLAGLHDQRAAEPEASSPAA